MLYSEYIKLYPSALDEIIDCLRNSHLPQLENVALRLSYALENKILDLKKDKEKVFLTTILVKTVNESFATIGSIEHGALLASYHHIRSIFELFACLEHVYSNPSKRERKLEKFIEFPNIANYLYLRKLDEQLSACEITKEQFEQACHSVKSNPSELEKRLPEWKRIWNLTGNDSNVKMIQNWHHPATIENLFKSSKETKEIWVIYEMICHATHLSPLGQRLIGGGYSVIELPRNADGFDYQRINRTIDAAIVGVQRIAICLAQKVNAGSIEGIMDWIPVIQP